MVIILAAQTVDVEGDASSLGEAGQTVRQHLSTEITDALATQAQLDDGKWSVR